MTLPLARRTITASPGGDDDEPTNGNDDAGARHARAHRMWRLGSGGFGAVDNGRAGGHLFRHDGGFDLERGGRHDGGTDHERGGSFGGGGSHRHLHGHHHEGPDDGGGR